MQNDDLEVLKQNTSIVDFGRDYYGFAPVNENKKYVRYKNPAPSSLVVDTQKNVFYYNKVRKAGSIIDFIMKFSECDLKSAIEILKKYNNQYTPSDEFKFRITKKEKQEFIAPVRAESAKNAFAYLVKDRCIDKVVFNSMERRRFVFQEDFKAKNGKVYKNAIFAGYDDNGKMNFAQSVVTKKKFNGNRQFDVEGSSYEQCFFVYNGAKSLIVTEAGIDTLSFMSLLNKVSKRFNNYNHQALMGSNNIQATANVLEKHPDIVKLYVAVDNDEAGDIAYQFIVDWANETKWPGTIKRMSPSKMTFNVNGETKELKDINDILRYNVDDKKFFYDLKRM